MDRSTIDAELGTPDAQQLLSTATLARLAYIGSDGGPRVVPVGFLWTRDTIVVSTADTSPKVKALMERPAVALSIDGGDTPAGAHAVSIRGHASVDIVEGITEEYLTSARKAMSGDELAQFEQACRDLYDRMARITITPDWARFYDYGTGRVPKFLQDLIASSQNA